MNFKKDWIAEKKPNESSTYYMKYLCPDPEFGVIMLVAVDPHFKGAEWRFEIFNKMTDDPKTWENYRAYDEKEILSNIPAKEFHSVIKKVFTGWVL